MLEARFGGPIGRATALPAVLWVAALALGPATSQGQDLAADWRGRLQEIGADLLDQRYERAEVAASDLGREMANSIVTGGGAELLLAMSTTYRALALAGLDRGDEAVWDWQVAQQLYPRVAEIDLGRFGPSGAFLSMHPPRVRAESSAGKTDDAESSSESRRGDFVPPRKLEAPVPDFPDGRVFRGLAVDVVVQLVVGVDGVPREPLILESRGEPTLVWATLDALRRWRFDPARRDGRPEASLYRLTASFVVPGE